MSSEPKTADALADAAVAEITSGMTVGLGTGRTASRAVHALSERVRAERLEVRCVPTSHVTETLARALGLKLIDFAMLEKIDFLFDGADEVDPQMRMLKGGGGAFVRERIVAHAAQRRVYIVDESKLVDRLGQRTTLAVGVMAFGLASIRQHLRGLGLHGVVRRTLDGHLFLTDNGSLIIDVTLEERDVDELETSLNAVPGVIDHGLFLSEADEIIIETTAGGLERMKREDEPDR
ncbi:MAG: ribose-5-phosphate isomerase RpiA [Phycisphaerales bacterium]